MNRLLTVLFYVTIFIWSLYPTIDADLGWHLRYGQAYLQTKQISVPNTYSTQNPDYIWPNHSWGTDIIIYTIYTHAGFVGLSIVASMLITLSYYLSIGANIGLIIPFTPLILWYHSQLLNLGMRTQLVSLLMMAIIYRLLNSPRPKIFYILPLLMLIWANTHGQFIFGIMTICLYGIVSQLNHRPLPRHFWLIAIASILVTLINPFGVELLRISLAHSDAISQGFVFEWMPWESGLRQFILISTIAAFGALVYHTKRNIRCFSYISLLYGCASLLARRFIPLFVLFVTAETSRITAAKYPRLIKKIQIPSFFLVSTLIVIGIIRFQHTRWYHQTWESYCRSHIRCSEALVSTLPKLDLQGNIFNSYRIGGWMIWRTPELKPFIDGRMTLWQDASHQYLFPQYQQMIQASDPQLNQFFSHDFDYAILQPQYPLAQYLKFADWQMVYQDEFLWVLQNPKADL